MDPNDSAFRRAEAAWLREPDYLTGYGEGCEACGCEVADDVRMCDDCAAAEDAAVAERLAGPRG
jgi:hypothetical protein